MLHWTSNKKLALKSVEYFKTNKQQEQKDWQKTTVFLQKRKPKGYTKNRFGIICAYHKRYNQFGLMYNYIKKYILHYKLTKRQDQGRN